MDELSLDILAPLLVDICTMKHEGDPTEQARYVATEFCCYLFDGRQDDQLCIESIRRCIVADVLWTDVEKCFDAISDSLSEHIHDSLKQAIAELKIKQESAKG